ncbi:neutral zinc metallopeptidase [Thermocatellispora tengchongensis]|uniref:neutral zinc metallopeptidase n=1 Tax=Thermocatellispora tengchongensis TaxID=1073253 RepID=UPI0036407D85
MTATLRALIPCLDRTWTAALAAAGYEYEPPEEVNLIDTPENAGCGTEDYDWAGIYCPDIHSVNVLVEDDWSFTSMFTLAHEYAHHVQEITGIAAQSGPEVFDEAWSRRLELQADCLAAVTLRGIDPQGLMVLRAHSVEDENAITQRQTHGSARNSAIWIHRGQDSGTIGACNTWAAPADEVS